MIYNTFYIKKIIYIKYKRKNLEKGNINVSRSPIYVNFYVLIIVIPIEFGEPTKNFERIFFINFKLLIIIIYNIFINFKPIYVFLCLNYMRHMEFGESTKILKYVKLLIIISYSTIT